MQLGKDFKNTLKLITEQKNLDEETVISSLEAAMEAAYKKSKPDNQEKKVRATIDSETGELSLSEIIVVADEIKDPKNEWTPEEAAENGYAGLSDGDKIEIPIEDISPEKFGRIAAQTARQVIIQRLKDAERKVVYEQFSDKINTVLTGTIRKSEGDQVLVSLNDKTEAIMPKEEKIDGESYVCGEKMKFYVLDVRQTTKGPRIVVSRTHPGLLRKLIEIEVPEIQDKTVEIVNIVREAGTRAKIAVKSLNPDVEPLGACVGKEGTRIRSISQELHGERIDIIVWSQDILAYIRNSLSPAKIARIEPRLDQDRSVVAYVNDDQLSLAIGRSGQNVRLAARLTGWKIDIKVKDEEKLPTMKDLFADFVDSKGDKK